MPSDSTNLDPSPPTMNPSSTQTESSATQSPAERPAQRILIGSERDRGSPTEAKANPVTPSFPSAAPAAPKKREPKHYPPPNIRDQLSPELDAGYQARL